MKELIEYDQLSTWAPESGDQLELYKMAMSGMVRSEARQIMALSENHFNVLYKRLKTNMGHGILGNDFRQLSRVKRLQFGIRKQYEEAMFLLQTERKTAGVPLARATARKAEKYGLFQIALDLSRELLRNYSTMSVDNKLFKYYEDKQKLYLLELKNELQAEGVFFRLNFQQKRGHPVDGFENEIDQLDQIGSVSDRFHYMRLVSRAKFHQIKREEAEMLAVCKDALKRFEGNEDLPYVMKFSFYYRAIAVHISRREFGQAEFLITRSMAGPAYGRHNWQIIMLQRALLGLHSGHPAMSLDAIRRAVRIPKKYRTKEMEERWMVMDAYLRLFGQGLNKQWRLRKFLNSLELTGIEKSGQNVSVTIVELMHLLKERKYEAFRKRCEGLDRYIRTHLKVQSMERTVAFMRMIQCVVRGGFQADEVKRKASPYLAQLRHSHPSTGADVREIEAVPFEVLWGLVLGFLK